MIVIWDDRLELAWMYELGESPPLSEPPGLRIKLEIGLGRPRVVVAVEPGEAESDVRGDRGPKPSVGGFLGLAFENLGICKRGRVSVKKAWDDDPDGDDETVCAGECCCCCCVGRSG